MPQPHWGYPGASTTSARSGSPVARRIVLSMLAMQNLLNPGVTCARQFGLDLVLEMPWRLSASLCHVTSSPDLSW